MEQQDYLDEDVVNKLKTLSPRYHDLTNEQKTFVDKLIVNDTLKAMYQRNQLCDECWQPNSDLGYCQLCNSKHFQENFKNWTSGNDKIDLLIQECQLQAIHDTEILEWIEYDRFYDVKFFDKGGFGTVYNAKWKDGYITSWNSEHKLWNRSTDYKETCDREKYKKVVLKVINDSQDINTEFLREIKSHQTMNNSSSIIRLYGMSKDPTTNNYMIIMNFAENGNLRNYLNKNYVNIPWERKLNLLHEISKGLNEIHEKGLSHRNFHSGNIVISKDFNVYITDLGLNKPANVGSNNKIFGVIPYMAPEILKKGYYGQKSDIYSFGMLVYEILTGYPPHHDTSHNELLANRIIQGLRPQIKIKIPKLLVELIYQCWDANPMNRPKAKELLNILQGYENDYYSNRESEIFKQINEADEYNNKFPSSASNHPQAIYTSRFLHFIKISVEPNNETLDETVLDLIDFSIPDIELDDDEDQ